MAQVVVAPPPLSVKVIVDWSTGSLKVTLMAAFGATLVSELPGTVATIAGGVLSGGASGPILPQAVSKTVSTRTKTNKPYNLFIIIVSFIWSRYPRARARGHQRSF